jgi:hypothetical protein
MAVDLKINVTDMHTYFRKLLFIYSRPVIIGLITFSLFPSVKINGQEVKDSIPDGTEGEMSESPVKDSAQMTWNQKRWRLFKGRYTTFKFGAGFLYDYTLFYRIKTASYKWIPWVLR